jgi:hypothetical protein
MRRTVLVMSLVVPLAACGRASVPSAPSQPPPPTAPRPAPSVTAISPNVGSTGGETPVVITGTALLGGVTVTFDGATVPAQFDLRYTDRIFVQTPAHAPGTVDVMLTNIGGGQGRLTAGYTYVPPESFDFNGTWTGYPYDGSDRPIGFTIENNGLVSFSCEESVVAFSPPVSAGGGAFAFTRAEGAATGRIVSASQALGTINVAPCTSAIWRAQKRQ